MKNYKIFLKLDIAMNSSGFKLNSLRPITQLAHIKTSDPTSKINNLRTNRLA